MDVELYVYDLSKGLARQMSMAFLGTQIDAVYHTALVFGGIEYFFGGGIQTSYPGQTHHGKPMEIIKLGKTGLDMPLILEYLESLKSIYTMESYDLFLHNCNNFCNDFSMFLVGKGIPDHITSLPQTVLNTPFGQMLKPQLDQAMRQVTQAPVAPAAIPPQPKVSPHTASATKQIASIGKVNNVTTLAELNRLLESAESTCAVIFFTSSTCGPCKVCYGPYDDLAEEVGSKGVLVKVDINFARDIASAHGIRATPTFKFFLRGEPYDEWAGADPNRLRTSVRTLLESANPLHPHHKLRLKILQQPQKPVLFSKVPPIEKLKPKLGSAASTPEISSLVEFINVKKDEPAGSATLPDLAKLSTFVKAQIASFNNDNLFAVVDLVRVLLADPRASAFYLEQKSGESMILALLQKVVKAGDGCPYALQIVTIQAVCNLFSSPLAADGLARIPDLLEDMTTLATAALLDEARPALRVSATSLAFNILAVNHLKRLDQANDALDTSIQVQLAASLIEAAERETSPDALKGLITSIGLLAYASPLDGEVGDVIEALDGRRVIKEKGNLIDPNIVADVTQVLDSFEII